jgi:hypothetical protein
MAEVESTPPLVVVVVGLERKVAIIPPPGAELVFNLQSLAAIFTTQAEAERTFTEVV